MLFHVKKLLVYLAVTITFLWKNVIFMNAYLTFPIKVKTSMAVKKQSTNNKVTKIL